MKSFIARTVDFAASDAAMTDEQIGQVDGGVVLLPMTAGEIVLAYNLPGVTDLKLPREVYPLIFLGEVTSWNDPRIVAANPGRRRCPTPTSPPSAGRTPAARPSCSPTTSPPISEKFKSTVTPGTNPQWPGASNLVAAPRNDGVTATVTQTPGCDRLHRVRLRQAHQHAGGRRCRTRPATSWRRAARAARSRSRAPSSRATICATWITDPKEAKAYPIATFTWMLFYKKQDAARPRPCAASSSGRWRRSEDGRAI